MQITRDKLAAPGAIATFAAQTDWSPMTARNRRSIHRFSALSTFKLVLMASASLAFLSACGGGGSDSGENQGSEVGAALGRWAPFACGDTDVGGTDTQSRGYMLFTRGANNAINTTGNKFLYSGSNCSGTRSFYQPESALITQARLTPQGVETYSGYTLRRYQNENINLQTGQVFNSYQLTFMTTPANAICLTAQTQALTAADIVQMHETDNSQILNCGSWEKLGDGNFQL
ncbi:hypothetical protein [Ottowia thiooxydans]|uniref:Lipocalin-like domain-containing protein n=1 Tax=Ottowia thiooxydans TaxID=219182 RepID=A0ABV2QFR9_9BURK